MATEKLLVKTKDNRVMAFDITFANAAEKARLKHQCETIANGIDFNAGFSGVVLPAGVMYDTQNSEFLNKEISGYHYRKNRAAFTNDMRHDPPAQPNTLYLSHRMDDNAFPEVVKNLGFEITPTDKQYTTHYDSTKREFVTTPDFDRTHALVYAASHRMEIVRNHFRFSPQDYSLLENLKQQFNREKHTHPDLTEGDFAGSLTDDKQRALFSFYANEVNQTRHFSTVIHHELKHVYNAMFRDGLSLKNNFKRLQTEDYYRIAVEDERSAYLSELVKNINEYLKKGDMNDFSMFNSNNSEVAEALKNLHTPEERLAYATDWPNLVAQKMHYFETSHRDYYDKGMKDERISYTDKLVKSLTQYLKNDNMDDFSMFSSENQRVVDELRRLNPPSERKTYLTDLNNRADLVNRELQRFDVAHPDVSTCGQPFKLDNYDADGDNFDEQFYQNVKMYVDNAPLAAPEDTDKSEFKKLRSLYYNFEIYNPNTHRIEHKNLAHYITPDLEVSLNYDAQRIINAADERLQRRKDQFNNDCRTGLIDTNLIYPAKALIRSNINNSEYVTQVESLRVAELFNDGTDTPTPSSATTSVSTPPTPDDCAQWSDDLQRYWQQVDGYLEVAKNNNEYMFKIREATVRYTGKKQVEVSSNADYNIYDKMLKEPTNRAAPVEFLDTLSKEQKLLLYIACVNNGRRMVGKVPTDLSGIDRLQGVPEAEMNKFRHRQQNASSNSPTPQRELPQQQRSRQISSTVQRAKMLSNLRGR